KQLLAELLRKAGPEIRLSAGIEGDARTLLRQMRSHGLEGIIAKERDSKYEPGQRSGRWVKLKWTLEQEFVIGGYTPPKGGRLLIGAILVGYYEHGKLRFASKVGTGFNTALLRSLFDRFQKLTIPQCPFVNLPEPP